MFLVQLLSLLADRLVVLPVTVCDRLTSAVTPPFHKWRSEGYSQDNDPFLLLTKTGEPFGDKSFFHTVTSVLLLVMKYGCVGR